MSASSDSHNGVRGRGRGSGERGGRGGRDGRGNHSGRGGRGRSGRGGHDSTSRAVYRHQRRTPLASQDAIIPRHFVNPIDQDPLRVMSTAARGTTVLLDSRICVDAGNLPVTLARDVALLMITHGHSDHVKDICNAFSDRDGKLLTLFCPESIALDLFDTIKLTHQINKGQQYTNARIAKHLRVYGVRRSSSATHVNMAPMTESVMDTVEPPMPITASADGKTEDDGSQSYLTRHDGDNLIPVVTLVDVGDCVRVLLGGRDVYAVVPFHCHHTVDTVGYSIYYSAKRLNDVIRIPKGTVIEITPPKMTAAEKKKYSAAKQRAKRGSSTVAAAAADASAGASAGGSNASNFDLDRINFTTVGNFVRALGIPPETIDMRVVSRTLESGYTMNSIRRIEFTSDVEIDAFGSDDSGESKCVLPKEAFVFFNEYGKDMNGRIGLDIYHNVLTPRTMVFGDTAATVFSQQLVCNLMNDARRIIIECTFLDGKDILSRIGEDTRLQDVHTQKKVKNLRRNLYLRLKEKEHIFLPELYQHFGHLADTQFVLMHFSDRYDVETVRDKITEVQRDYPNVYGAV